MDGPSASDQQAREYSREKRRTESYIRQLDEVIADDVLITSEPRPLENVTYSVIKMIYDLQEPE